MSVVEPRGSAFGRVLERFGRMRRKMPRRAVEQLHLPPAWLGYSWVRRESVREYFQRTFGNPESDGRFATIHSEAVANYPLPRNISRREDLPDAVSWWGFSFRGVPDRILRPTIRATVPRCRVAPHIDPVNGQFYVVILNSDDRALSLREMNFRHGHAAMLRCGSRKRMAQATWLTERVFHNPAHWLTAHLPKFLLLQSRGELSDVLLPRQRPVLVDESLRLLGLDPSSFATFDNEVILEVDELTVLDTDRFRPELVRLVWRALRSHDTAEPYRRVFISRSGAAHRKLVNEEEVWRLLESVGFERVNMEELGLDAQVQLMAEAAVVAAPHGAGLANMIFCAPGTEVLEIVDVARFPNPNFYALASALGHAYWLVPALTSESAGVLPPWQDMRVELSAVENTLRLMGLTSRS